MVEVGKNPPLQCSNEIIGLNLFTNVFWVSAFLSTGCWVPGVSARISLKFRWWRYKLKRLCTSQCLMSLSSLTRCIAKTCLCCHNHPKVHSSLLTAQIRHTSSHSNSFRCHWNETRIRLVGSIRLIGHGHK